MKAPTILQRVWERGRADECFNSGMSVFDWKLSGTYRIMRVR